MILLGVTMAAVALNIFPAGAGIFSPGAGSGGGGSSSVVSNSLANNGSVVLKFPDGTVTNGFASNNSDRGALLTNFQLLATSGSVISLYGNATITTPLGADGVNWYISPGCIISNLNALDITAGQVFRLSNSCTIGGFGSFYALVSSPIDCFGMTTNHIIANVIANPGNLAGFGGIFTHETNTTYLTCDRIYDKSDTAIWTIDASTLHFTAKELNGFIIIETGTGGSSKVYGSADTVIGNQGFILSGSSHMEVTFGSVTNAFDNDQDANPNSYVYAKSWNGIKYTGNMFDVWNGRGSGNGVGLTNLTALPQTVFGGKPAAVTVGASPFVYLNPTGAPLQMWLDDGAALYSISLNGVSIRTSLSGAYAFILAATNSIVLTYPVTAPTLNTNKLF